MADGAGARQARIGPNALIQLAPILDATHGVAARRALFLENGVVDVPDGSEMIEEGPVAAIHQAMRARFPDTARPMARAAGLAVGDYILAHRIPRTAQALLRTLPAGLSTRILSRAILSHAWTFCGSGTVTAEAGHPTTFEIRDNPFVRGETSDRPLCHWHAAVFERLYSSLVHRRAQASEIRCGAQGVSSCRFEINWR